MGLLSYFSNSKKKNKKIKSKNKKTKKKNFLAQKGGAFTNNVYARLDDDSHKVTVNKDSFFNYLQWKAVDFKSYMKDLDNFNKLTPESKQKQLFKVKYQNSFERDMLKKCEQLLLAVPQRGGSSLFQRLFSRTPPDICKELEKIINGIVFTRTDLKLNKNGIHIQEGTINNVDFNNPKSIVDIVKLIKQKNTDFLQEFTNFGQILELFIKTNFKFLLQLIKYINNDAGFLKIQECIDGLSEDQRTKLNIIYYLLIQITSILQIKLEKTLQSVESINIEKER